MSIIQVPQSLIYLVLVFVLLLMGALGYLSFLFYQKYSKDIVIFIDKANRWSMSYQTLKNKKDFSNGKRKYFIKGGLLSAKGKALYIYPIDKPFPMIIQYKKNEGLNSESMMSIINNKLIQQLVRTKSELEDKLLLFGAIGGMIAGIGTALLLAKQFGVI